MFPWPYPSSSSMTWIRTHLWFWRPVGVSHANLHMDMFFLWSVLKCQMLHNKSRKNHDSATMSHISNKTGVQAQTEAPTPKISQPAGRPLIRHRGLAAECFDQHLPTPAPNQPITKHRWKCHFEAMTLWEGNSHKKKLSQKPLKCPVSASVFCVVCVLLSFPYSLGSQRAWGPDHGQGGCLSAFGRANASAEVAHTVLDCGGAFRNTRYAQYWI